jgi:hypothetical protein
MAKENGLTLNETKKFEILNGFIRISGIYKSDRYRRCPQSGDINKKRWQKLSLMNL